MEMSFFMFSPRAGVREGSDRIDGAQLSTPGATTRRIVQWREEGRSWTASVGSYMWGTSERAEVHHSRTGGEGSILPVRDDSIVRNLPAGIPYNPSICVILHPHWRNT